MNVKALRGTLSPFRKSPSKILGCNNVLCFSAHCTVLMGKNPETVWKLNAPFTVEPCLAVKYYTITVRLTGKKNVQNLLV